MVQVSKEGNQLKVVTNGLVDYFDLKNIQTVSPLIFNGYFVVINFYSDVNNDFERDSLSINLSLVDNQVGWTLTPSGLTQAVTDISGWKTESETPTSEYTETIVNISSAEILAMGTTPIELLPAAGVGMYYDIDKFIFEYTHVNDAYVFPTALFMKIEESSCGNFISITNSLIEETNNSILISFNRVNGLSPGGDWPINYKLYDNGGYNLTTNDSTNPTLGDGTLRVKIYHKTITFGA
jgi:hypothetical protein